MKLNPDCIRDVLLYLEENLEITPKLEIKSIPLGKIANSVSYPIEETANTLLTLDEGGLIIAKHNTSGNNMIYQFSVSRITYSGYQFIETIRPKSVWKQILAALKSVGSFSIPMIQEIAPKIVETQILALNDQQK